MMEYCYHRGFKIHLLGLCSIRHFVGEELPAALAYGVRGLDTCAAFTLGVRGMELTKDSPRLFLGDINASRYSFLGWEQLLLIEENMRILDTWVEGPETEQ